MIPGSTMTTERIEAFERVAFAAPAQAVPPEVTKTQEKIREMLRKKRVSAALQEPDAYGKGGLPRRSRQLSKRHAASRRWRSDAVLRLIYQRIVPIRLYSAT